MLEIKKQIKCNITGRPIERITKIDTHELAWAAGFFDGEGCSYCILHETWNPIIRIEIGQMHDAVLKRFKKAVLGLGNITRRQSNNAYQLKFSNFEHAQVVMALLWKYLSPVKKQQYRHAVEQFHKNWKGNIQSGWSYKRNLTTPSPALSNAVNGEMEVERNMTGG